VRVRRPEAPPGRSHELPASVTWALRLAGLNALINGVGFGGFDVPAIWHLAQYHEIWNVNGDPTYGNGPFEDHGITVAVPVLLAFLGACLVLTVGGALLLVPRADGVVVTLAGIVMCAPFWWGFDLPFAWFNAAIVIVLLLLAAAAWRTWASLRRAEPRPAPQIPTRTAVSPITQQRPRSHAAALVIAGGTCGVAWAAGLRGFMAQITVDSSVSWAGTSGYILLPGLMVGMLLAWAEHLRRTGGRRGWRWLALSPLLFTAVLFSHGPFQVLGIFEDGIGGGALAVPLYAMAGGYALSGRGPRGGRAMCGVLVLTAVPIWALTAESIAGPDFVLTNPRGFWVAVYYYSFLAVLSLAAAIPHRAADTARNTVQATDLDLGVAQVP
jgi:hypothetical protein